MTHLHLNAYNKWNDLNLFSIRHIQINPTYETYEKINIGGGQNLSQSNTPFEYYNWTMILVLKRQLVVNLYKNCTDQQTNKLNLLTTRCPPPETTKFTPFSLAFRIR